MAENYTLKIRRYNPESGDTAYWSEYGVELDPERSVLDGILQAKDREDASIGIRCSLPRRHLRLVRRADQRQDRAGVQHAHLRRRRPGRRRRRRSWSSR